MAHDPRQLRPTELCRLLNSTPLGEVIKQRQMQEHRVQAGLRIGTHKHVDLLRYVAWLVQLRHARSATSPAAAPGLDLDQLALDVALSVNQEGEQRLSAKQEALLAAMLTEATCAAAAHKVGVSRMTAHRWLKTKPFQERYRRARQQLVNTAIGRLQLGSGLAVDALMSIVVQMLRRFRRGRSGLAASYFVTPITVHILSIVSLPHFSANPCTPHSEITGQPARHQHRICNYESQLQVGRQTQEGAHQTPKMLQIVTYCYTFRAFA